MAELLAVGTAVGVAASLVTLGDTAWRVLKRLKEYSDRVEDVPPAIEHIKAQLPVLIDKMEELKQGNNSGLVISPQSALATAVRSCEKQIMHLDVLTERMLPGKTDSASKRARKALLSIYYEREVSKAWAELDNYKTTIMFHFTNVITTVVQTPVADIPATHYSYPSLSVSHFVDRKSPLKQIEDTLSGSKDTIGPSVVVLLGMGGCGKTQLALEYCRQCEANRRFRSIFWVDASNVETAVQSFVSIAAVITGNKITFGDDDGAAVQFVKGKIGTWKDPWLIVFDNFDDPSAFEARQISTFFPQGEHGAILFTSRHGDTKRLGHTIAIAEMLESEGLELFLQQSGCEKSNENKRTGKEIVHRLGSLALAISQAGAYISARNLPLHLFMDHYNSRREKVLKETPSTLWEYRRKLDTSECETSLSVFTTWEMSFGQIGTSDGGREMKEHLLAVSAFFDNKSISAELFQIYFELEKPEWMKAFCSNGVWDRYEFQDILAELSKLSLLQSVENSATGTHFSLHPLIQDWMKLRSKSLDCRSYAREAILILSIFIGAQDTDKMTLKSKQTVTLHLDASLQNDASFLSYRDGLGSLSLVLAATNFASFYQSQGRYKESKQLYRRALEGRERELGPDHLDTLDTAQRLASIYRKQGRNGEAEKLCMRVLKGREKRLGPDHPDTLQTVHGLAGVYHNQGQYKEAEQLCKRALEGNGRQLGPDHPSTLRAAFDLASAYHNQGRYKKAEQLYKRVFEGNEKQLGPDHPDTLWAVQGLAGAYHDQGRYKEAMQLCERALEGREKQLGPEHHHTLQTTHDLASAYTGQGRYKEAEQLYKRALEGSEKQLGPDHPDTLRAVRGLAGAYHNQGRYKEAEQLYKRVFEGSEKQLGPDHPDTLRAVQGLAGAYYDQDRYKEAEQLYKRVFEGNEKQLGPDHPDTLWAVQGLAGAYHDQGRYKEAVQLCERALEGREKQLGPDHTDTLRAAQGLASAYAGQGRYKKAEQLYVRTLKAREGLLGPGHPNTLFTANSLLNLYQVQGRHEEAEQLQNQYQLKQSGPAPPPSSSP